MLAQFLRQLTRMSAEFGIAVVLTNQGAQPELACAFCDSHFDRSK